jgi:polyhydroxybutyrate depolymerase
MRNVTLICVLLIGCGEALESPAPAPLPSTSGTTPPPSVPTSSPAPAVDASAPEVDPPAPVCVPEWQPGFEEVIQKRYGARDRSYLVHVGKAVKGSPALVVNFHGLTNSPRIQAGLSGMNALADEQGFVVVYPQGVANSFNAGECCGTASQENIDDLGFTRAIVADVLARACADKRRVYATGFSNGGFMSNRIGCEAADMFVAIAPVGGASAVTSCGVTRGLPVIGFHGTADTIVPYDNGKKAIMDWVTRNACTGSPARTTAGSSYCDTWSSCKDGAKVTFCTITGGSHLWPGDRSAIPASPAIMGFFKETALP